MPARRNRPPKRVRANRPPPPRVGLNEYEGSRRPNNSAVPLTHLAGLVMWLPPEAEIPVDTNLQDGCYDHPVLILSPQPAEGEVVILIMTSLGGMDLLQKYPRNMALRRKHLPVYPSNPHPDLDVLLSLQDDKTLTKKSYIQTERQHSIDLAALRPYRGRPQTKYVLRTESYQQVIKHAGFHAPIPSPVATTVRSDPALDIPHQLRQGIDLEGLIGHRAREERLNLRGAALGYGTIAPTRDYSPQRAQSQTLYDAYVRRYVQSARLGPSLPLYHDAQPRTRSTNHYVPQHSSRHPSRGRNSSHPILRDFIVPLVMVLAVGAGAGFGMYSAWVYRAALGKALVNGILWIGKHLFELLKVVGKLVWKLVAWVGRHVGEMVKWVWVKGWEVIKGVFSRLL